MDEKKIAIYLILILKSGALNDNEQGHIVEILNRIMPDPDYWNYTINSKEDLNPEEIVEKAFSYKPIQL